MGNQCSSIAFDWAKRTFANREGSTGHPILGAEGSFSNLMQFGSLSIAMASDGIGTKVELAERTGIFDTLGFDLVAMVVDDLAANGIEPVNLSNVLDVDRLDPGIVDSLMKGLYEAARFAGIAVTGGEIAELGSRIGGFGEGMHFNWCATGIGVLPTACQPIDGKRIQASDRVISLKSRGFRSNGFSLVRKIMSKEFGETWHDEEWEAGQTFGEALLTPSLIFSPLITDLVKTGCQIHAVAHITGGGVVDNLGRVLKGSSLGAVLDNLHEPLPIMRRLMSMGAILAKQAWSLWNMGNGMLIVLPPDQVDSCLAQARDSGYQAVEAGRLTDKSSEIAILDRDGNKISTN